MKDTPQELQLVPQNSYLYQADLIYKAAIKGKKSAVTKLIKSNEDFYIAINAAALGNQVELISLIVNKYEDYAQSFCFSIDWVDNLRVFKYLLHIQIEQILKAQRLSGKGSQQKQSKTILSQANIYLIITYMVAFQGYSALVKYILDTVPSGRIQMYVLTSIIHGAIDAKKYEIIDYVLEQVKHLDPEYVLINFTSVELIDYIIGKEYISINNALKEAIYGNNEIAVRHIFTRAEKDVLSVDIPLESLVELVSHTRDDYSVLDILFDKAGDAFPLVSTEGEVTEIAQTLMKQASLAGNRKILNYIENKITEIQSKMETTSLLSITAKNIEEIRSQLESSLEARKRETDTNALYASYTDLIAFELLPKGNVNRVHDLMKEIKDKKLNTGNNLPLFHLLRGYAYNVLANTDNTQEKHDYCVKAMQNFVRAEATLPISHKPLLLIGKAVTLLHREQFDKAISLRDSAEEALSIDHGTMLHKLYDNACLVIGQVEKVKKPQDDLSKLISIVSTFREETKAGLKMVHDKQDNLAEKLQGSSKEAKASISKLQRGVTQTVKIGRENSQKLDDIQATLEKLGETLESVINDIHIDIEELYKKPEDKAPFADSKKQVRNFYLVFNRLMQDLYKASSIASEQGKVDASPVQLGYATDATSASMSILHTLQASSNAFPIIGAFTNVVSDMIKAGYIYRQRVLFSRAARNFNILDEEDAAAFIKEEAIKITSMWEPLLNELNNDPAEAIKAAKYAVARIFESYQVTPKEFEKREKNRKAALIQKYTGIITAENIEDVMSYYDPYVSALLTPSSTLKLLSSTSLTTTSLRGWHVNGFFTKVGLCATDIDPEQTFGKIKVTSDNQLEDKVTKEAKYEAITGKIADAIINNFDIGKDVVMDWVSKVNKRIGKSTAI